jgi:hypothetical protein
MEAGAGIEPANRGFADLGLTTWLPRRRKDGKLTPRERLSIGDVRAKSGSRDERVQRVQVIEWVPNVRESTKSKGCLEALGSVDSLRPLNPLNPLISDTTLILSMTAR